ncbi:MAG: hypothetical protein R3F17_08280 [Planctomycetota bacterium]
MAGQQTFGVKASGIHRFTATVAAIFFITAVTITVLNRWRGYQQGWWWRSAGSGPGRSPGG